MTAARLHHVGYVVLSIEESAPAIARSMQVVWTGEIIHDPLQMVRVTFFPADERNSTLIELVEPKGPRSPVKRFAESGGGLHHICYEVADLSAELERRQQDGEVLVRPPMRAMAFQGRRIAWFRAPTGLLVELLEEKGG